MSDPDPHPSLNFHPADGFHVLKDQWTTITYLKEYCERLAPQVCVAASATIMAVAPYRRSLRELPYLQHNRPPITDINGITGLEDRYERGLFWLDSRGNDWSGSGWERHVQYQVPMADRVPSPLGLGAIDLLAIQAGNTPAVVELKAIPAGRTGAETVLRALLEAAAYACVLKADWTYFRAELAGYLKERGIPGEPPTDCRTIPLVIAGNADYWNFWARTNSPEYRRAVPAIGNLLTAFRENGFPVTFVRVDGILDNTLDLSVREVSFPSGE